MTPDSDMQMARRHRRTALGFVLVWLLILLAGADHPPPLGFLWLLPALSAVGMLVHWRLPRYARWKVRKAPWRFARVAGEGALAGGVLGAVFAGPRLSVLNMSAFTQGDVWILLSVAAVLGMFNAWVVYGLAVVDMEV